jgi:hypothetical protein
MVDVAKSCIETGRLSIVYWKLDAIILREGLAMFRQLLAQLVPRRRLFRLWATRATEASTHEPPCDTVLGKVYYTHAALHGPNKLLPVDALPDPPESLRTKATEGESKPA